MHYITANGVFMIGARLSTTSNYNLNASQRKKAVLNIYRTAYYRKYNFRINIYSRGVTNLFQGFTTASSTSCVEFSTP